MNPSCPRIQATDLLDTREGFMSGGQSSGTRAHFATSFLLSKATARPSKDYLNQINASGYPLEMLFLDHIFLDHHRQNGLSATLL